MAHFIFVVVAHIDKYRVRIVQHGVNFCRFQVVADVAGIEGRIVNPVRDDTIADLHAQHPEGFTIVIKGDIQTQVFKRRIKAVQPFAQLFHEAGRDADLGVNALVGEIDTAKDL